MKALIFRGKQNIAYETVPDPKIESAKDAIVRVVCMSICGSDLHVYHGRETGLDPGTVMGHEFVGEVVETGNAIHSFRAGDLVFSPFTVSCGECFFCRSDLSSRCQRSQLFGWVEEGKGLQGAQAEYVRVPLAESTLMKVPDGISLEEALMLGDNFTTGYYCARLADVRPEGTYVVIGCGSVGLSALIVSKQMGAWKLFAVDPVPHRRNVARRLGAVALSPEEDVARLLKEATGGRGADAVMELVGLPAAQSLALDVLRPGGTLAVVGVHTSREFGFSPAQAFEKNLIHKTGRCPVRSYLDQVIPILHDAEVDLSSIFSHRMPLSDGAEAYRIFDEKRNGCIKVLMQPGEDV